MLERLTGNRWGIFYFLVLCSLLAAAIYFSGSKHEIRLRLQYGVFDQFNKAHPREPSEHVVIVDLDEKSLEEIGQWPWPRNIMAALVTDITSMGAKAIAFDGVMAEVDRTSPKYFLENFSIDHEIKTYILENGEDKIEDYDEIFAKAIKQSGIYITAFSYGGENRTQGIPVYKNAIAARNDVQKDFMNNVERFETAAINLPAFANNAAGNGSFMANPDYDGIIRSTGMIFTDGVKLYPSLSLEALRIGLLGRKGRIKIGPAPESEQRKIDTAYRIIVGEKVIPVDSNGVMQLYFRKMCRETDVAAHRDNCRKADYIPAYKVLDKNWREKHADKIKDKIVLIGASAEGLKDIRNTGLQAFVPGVEIHANAIEQVLQGKYLLRPAITQAAESSYILFAGLFFIIVSPFIGIVISILLCATIIGLASFGAYYMYVNNGILIDPVYPSLAVLTIFIVSTILSYARAESRRKYIRGALGLYVSPDVMKSLEKSPDKLRLGGETRELTVMFTDIRKFTSISEGMEPESLIHMMNEFLTAMTEIVLENEGTVDKYIGDAMMAFWNAPRTLENHERYACYAALNMQAALAPVNRSIMERAEREGRMPIPLSAGIGINTGRCAVGNMGSRQRFAYSALGDAVNLSARLEGQTKFYGVNILISESTYDRVPGMAALELDLVQVIGKARPVRIYALLGDEEMASTKNFKTWSVIHADMLIRYRKRDFDGALERIAECRKNTDGSLEDYYKMYRKRITDLKKKKKLPKDWQGVFIAESK